LGKHDAPSTYRSVAVVAEPFPARLLLPPQRWRLCCQEGRSDSRFAFVLMSTPVGRDALHSAVGARVK